MCRSSNGAPFLISAAQHISYMQLLVLQMFKSLRVDCRGGPGTDGEEPRQAADASSSGAGEEGTLVGTVEVSVAASTRTRFLTLNAPEVSHLQKGPSSQAPVCPLLLMREHFSGVEPHAGFWLSTIARITFASRGMEAFPVGAMWH